MTDRELLEKAAKAAGRKLIDPIGEKYGRLLVLSEADRNARNKRQFLCLCDCGKEVVRLLNAMRTGHTLSCGCLHLETIANGRKLRPLGRTKHGLNKTPEHQAWVSMRQRCTNQNRREWTHYGGRGITVCKEWSESFDAFLAAVGPRPSPKHSLDRIDVNGNYEPGNVRWATQQTQIENTRTVRNVTINGKTQTISAWERENGLSRGQVRAREASGWSIQEAILTPSIKGQKVHRRAAAAIGEQK